MPSGKKARQQRRAAAASGGRTPPPVRSKAGGRGPGRFSQRTLVIAGVVLAVAIGLGVGLPLALSSSGSGSGSASTGSTGTTGFGPISKLGKLASPGPLGPLGPEGPPIESGSDLAPAGSPAPGESVDGISCQGGEQTLFHIHARLTIFVDGRSERVPAGVGIADPQAEQTTRGPFVANGACFSWLHTHAADGIIHIESPVQRTFTLGNFFDVWGQPLSSSQVGPAKGHVTALVDGKVWLGDPSAIPLKSHRQIQLEVGRPLVAQVRIENWSGL
ncbi:MAG TPA: hypothetical protein VJ716_00620 [Gaiellaceae bacterium]|nr:hypothetical protein [Gaiellaceae bacterium]